MSRAKKSKAVPIVLVITILLAVLAVVCFLINPLVIQPKKDAIDKAYDVIDDKANLKNIDVLSSIRDELLDNIELIARTLDGMKEERR